MRTILNIEDDVLIAVKELARTQNKSLGGILSELGRHALNGGHGQTAHESSKTGFRPFPACGYVVSNDLVNSLREKEGV